MTDDARGPLERAYDDEVVPLMIEVRRLCKVHGIRMAAAFDLDVREEDGEALMGRHTTVLGDDFDNASKRLQGVLGAMYPAEPRAYAITVMTRKAES